jgi:transcriptional regulator with XRE-family HTH domain
MTEDTGAGKSGYDDRTIGLRLRRIRKSRRLSLRAVAGLAGISAGHLSRIERGEHALDRRSVQVALANALRVSPSDLTALPIPAPANGTTDGSVNDVRRALMAVGAGRPGGQVQPIEQLQARAETVENSSYDRRGLELPALIADLHTTMAEGRTAELLRLAVMVHIQSVRGWLYITGAPLDLRWQTSLLACQAARELDEPLPLGVAAWGTTIEMLTGGAFQLARSELDATAVPTDTSAGMQLDGMLALSRSLVASAENDRAGVESALDHATDMAEHTGQGDAFRMGFGPTNVGLWRMASALESNDPDTVIRTAKQLTPAQHPSRERQATYWMDLGRALTRVRRHDDAIRALRRGEDLFPMRVLRNPFARDSLAELVAHSKDDAAGQEIRGMAFRAGLPV